MHEAPKFRLLASGKVQQTIGTETTEFDPEGWATYSKGSAQVKACRVPREFEVAGDLCTDGWLVKDAKGLKTIGNESFSRDYSLALVLGEVPAVEAA